jgi:hypothetical protein
MSKPNNADPRNPDGELFSTAQQTLFGHLINTLLKKGVLNIQEVRGLFDDAIQHFHAAHHPRAAELEAYVRATYLGKPAGPKQ